MDQLYKLCFQRMIEIKIHNKDLFLNWVLSDFSNIAEMSFGRRYPCSLENILVPAEMILLIVFKNGKKAKVIYDLNN